MAQPTQELPPWFTASVDTLLGADGVPFTTSTTLLFLPLTYYGPSVSILFHSQARAARYPLRPAGHSSKWPVGGNVPQLGALRDWGGRH